MIYIFSALYPEVQALIQEKNLKKQGNSGRFQQFADSDRNLLLTLTGVGEISAAATVAAVLSKENAGKGDFLLSLGSCAWIRKENSLNLGEDFKEQGNYWENPPKIGEYLLLNSLKSLNSGRTFYPDLLERSSFREVSCLTGSKVISEEEDLTSSSFPFYDVYDMEASAVYEAANFFLGPEQMRFLRLLTDYGRGNEVSASDIQDLSLKKVEEIIREVDKLLCISEEAKQGDEILTNSELFYVDKLASDMKLSKTLSDQLRQNILFFALSQLPWKEITENWYEEGMLPCRDKRTGQKLLGELKSGLLN